MKRAKEDRTARWIENIWKGEEGMEAAGTGWTCDKEEKGPSPARHLEKGQKGSQKAKTAPV